MFSFSQKSQTQSRCIISPGSCSWWRPGADHSLECRLLANVPQRQGLAENSMSARQSETLDLCWILIHFPDRVWVTVPLYVTTACFTFWALASLLSIISIRLDTSCLDVDFQTWLVDSTMPSEGWESGREKIQHMEISTHYLLSKKGLYTTEKGTTPIACHKYTISLVMYTSWHLSSLFVKPDF